MSEGALEQARQMRGTVLLHLGDMTVAYLAKNGASVPLRDLLTFLRTVSRDDALISRALATLQAAQRIHLDVDRNMRLLPYPPGSRGDA